MPAPSLMKYCCEAEGCGAEIISNDLGPHYRNHTNFETLVKLKVISKSGAEKALLPTVDTHTKYMYLDNFSRNKLSSYKTHRQAKKLPPPGLNALTRFVNRVNLDPDIDDPGPGREQVTFHNLRENYEISHRNCFGWYFS